MALSPWTEWLLAVGALVVVLSTVPYAATGVSYRRSDNGLAYIALVTSVAVWNGAFAAQLLTADPLVGVFFYALSAVGVALAALGWFLFATTASSTPPLPVRRAVYGAAVLVGVDISLAVTSPAHALYWTLPPDAGAVGGFAVVVPAPGYWLHVLLVSALFAGGTLWFASVPRGDSAGRYGRAYATAGTATVAAFLGGAAFAPGGLSVAPLVAAALTTVGWVQAERGRVLSVLRPHLPSLTDTR